MLYVSIGPENVIANKWLIQRWSEWTRKYKVKWFFTIIRRLSLEDFWKSLTYLLYLLTSFCWHGIHKLPGRNRCQTLYLPKSPFMPTFCYFTSTIWNIRFFCPCIVLNTSMQKGFIQRIYESQSNDQVLIVGWLNSVANDLIGSTKIKGKDHTIAIRSNFVIAWIKC